MSAARTSTSTLLLAGAALILSPACLVPNPIGAEERVETGTEDEGGLDDEAGTTAMDPAGGDGGLDGEDTGSSEDTGSNEGTGSGETGGSDEAPIPDMPSQTCGNIDELSEGCTTCLELQCCEALAGCADDLECACFVTCLLGGSDEDECSLSCDPLSLPSAQALLSCSELACPEAC